MWCDSSMGDHCVSTVQFSFKVVVDMLGCHFFHTLIVCFETHPNSPSLVSPQRCPQCRQAESLLEKCAYSLCVLRRWHSWWRPTRRWKKKSRRRHWKIQECCLLSRAMQALEDTTIHVGRVSQYDLWIWGTPTYTNTLARGRLVSN